MFIKVKNEFLEKAYSRSNNLKGFLDITLHQLVTPQIAKTFEFDINFFGNLLSWYERRKRQVE